MIQIDMPMPTNCIDCPACNEYLMCAIPVNGRGWSESDVKDFSQSRPEWCPMKEQEAVTGSADGTWIQKADATGHEYSMCSACETVINTPDGYGGYYKLDMSGAKYCPNCGAKMD